MGIEAPGKMVEQVDLAVKKEDKASNEVSEAILSYSTNCISVLNPPEC